MQHCPSAVTYARYASCPSSGNQMSHCLVCQRVGVGVSYWIVS